MMSGEIPGSAIMSATEAVEWMAVRERRTLDDLKAEQREYEDWCLTLPIEEVREAAQELAKPEPGCLLKPRAADVQAGVLPGQGGYLTQLGAPGGRDLLGVICARLERRFGRPMSYADLAAQIGPTTSAINARRQARLKARAMLLDHLQQNRIRARGRPDGGDGQPDPTAKIQLIPDELFFEPGISLEGDRLVSQRSLGAGQPGRSFSEVRFYAAEVAALCRATHGDRAPAKSGSLASGTTEPTKHRIAPNSLAARDAPLVKEMHALLGRGEAQSPWQAARLVAPKSAGSRHADSAAKRLLGRFKKSAQS